MYSRIKNAFLRWFFPPEINQSPIFILGNQKAGTSAIAHLLAEYGGLSKTVDIPESFWPTLEKLLSGELSVIDFANRHKHRFSSDIIKDPNFTFFYDQLKVLHPQGSFVFIIRDPRDNIRSLLDRMGLPGDRDSIHLPSYKISDAWLAIFDQDLWGFDNDQYIEILALRWNSVTDVYLDHKSEITLVRYEDFLSDKIGFIERTAKLLGIAHINDIYDKIDIQYQYKGKQNVSWMNFFKEKNLGRIERICGERMALFGYKTTL